MGDVVQELTNALGGSSVAFYAVVALAVVQLAIQIWALVDLARIPRVVGGRKWVWALVIIFLSNFVLGAILYFAIGRRVPVPAEETLPAPDDHKDRANRAVDTLYGPSGEDVTR